ncbi:hypothetical protein QTP86_032751, partial [Hemibagrus guttatus]
EKVHHPGSSSVNTLIPLQNDFYAWFEVQNNVAARKTIPPPNDQVLCISTADMKRTLCRANPRKLARPGNIPGRVFRECAEQLADVFTEINISLSSAIVPTCFKTMTMVSCLNDYRPVAHDEMLREAHHEAHQDPVTTLTGPLAVCTSVSLNWDWDWEQHLHHHHTEHWGPSGLFAQPTGVHSADSVEIVKVTKFLGAHLSVSTSHLPPPILTVFYRVTIECVLRSCITTWFGNCTVSDRKTLQRIVGTAKKIIGVSLPSITDIYNTHCTHKASSIVDDPTHPSHTLFTLLLSGK